MTDAGTSLAFRSVSSGYRASDLQRQDAIIALLREYHRTVSLSVPARISGLVLPPFDPLNGRAAALRAEGHHVISLGQALPFFPPPAPALAAAQAALSGSDVHHYATDPGLPSLRRALATRLSAAAGQDIGADDLIITAGANHAFTLALLTMLEPGDEVVLPAPYFTNHHMAITAVGARPIEAPIADRERFALRWEDIAAALTPATAAIVLCTPANPTGAVIPPREGARIVAECAARGLLVLCDETYMGFVYEGDAWTAASVRGWRDHVIVLGTFSKSFGMMGWRVGFLLADARICREATKVQDATIICAPVISQIAAEAAVREAWAYPASYGDEFRARRRLMQEGLASIPRLRWTPTAGGLFAFARVEGVADADRLAHDLLETAHVVTIPGSAFGRSSRDCLRLSFGYAARADLDEALVRLRARLAGVP